MVLILAGLFLLFLPVSFVDDHGLFSKVFILMPLGLIFLLIGGLLIKQACGEKDSGGAWGSMFRFLQETPKFITPQHPPEPQGEGGPALSRHVTYHKRIVWVGGVFGGLGLVLGLLISLMVLNLATKRPGTWNLILMSPIVSAALFTFVGIAVACLFAPREFLCGPLGTKWMKLIGIRNILGARIVCALLSVIGILGMALLGWELIRRLW
ncbi:MAG TPA: hypothetical protein VKE98_02175 [Gemmataceae bacterium]|nr:hypothetical protein [Gemmataceae bacterium]